MISMALPMWQYSPKLSKLGTLFNAMIMPSPLTPVLAMLSTLRLRHMGVRFSQYSSRRGAASLRACSPLLRTRSWNDLAKCLIRLHPVSFFFITLLVELSFLENALSFSST
uniref:Uncharacterized protein n=1 Tax=Cacopsylla melanoneura TaxID=428564 RepID=A0A8D8XHS0_9HEMI